MKNRYSKKIKLHKQSEIVELYGIRNEKYILTWVLLPGV